MVLDPEGRAGALMWSEIQEQPKCLCRVADSGLDFLSGKSAGDPFSSRFLSRVERVILFGNGSSYHAACLARDYFVKMGGLAARAIYASDAFWLEEPRSDRVLAMAFSHSGRSKDVLDAVKRARGQGIPIAAVTNIEGSPLSRSADVTWVTGAGVEKAIPSTKGFTALIAASLLVTFHAGSARGFSNGAVEAKRIIQKAARALDDWLELPHQAQAAAEPVACARAAAFVGRAFLYPVACDGALKLLEVAYIPAMAYPPAEFRHGPMAIAEKGIVLVALIPRRRSPSLLRILSDVKGAGAKVVAVGEKDSVSADVTIEVPTVPPVATPLVYMPPLQVLAHQVGVKLGRPIDRPRGLKKVVGAA